MFQLRCHDIVLPQRSGQSAMLFLRDTKTAQRSWQSSKQVLFSERTGIACLRLLYKRRGPDDNLVVCSPAAFRTLWKEVALHLDLEAFNCLPYSGRGNLGIRLRRAF